MPAVYARYDRFSTPHEQKHVYAGNAWESRIKALAKMFAGSFTSNSNSIKNTSQWLLILELHLDFRIQRTTP